MASLAREFRVPTLLNTRQATKVIPRGRPSRSMRRTGTCISARFPGCRSRAGRDRRGPRPPETRHAPRFTECLERWSTLLIPLNLIDPAIADFRPENCRTLHDLTRFVHEKSYDEMFQLGEKLGDVRASSYALDVFLPIDLYIIDSGEG